MPETPRLTALAGRKIYTAQWLIAVLLAFVAGLLWTRAPGGAGPTAFAQQPPLVGARGVYAFTGQLDHNRFGLFMLDIEQGTIWCYEIDNVNGVRKLRLIAARSWIYDRYLRDFNCAGLSYKQVQELVAQERSTPPSAGSGTAADRDLASPRTEDSPDSR